MLAWRDLPQLRDADRFDAWLHRLLVNACYREAPNGRRWAAVVRVLPVDEPERSDDYVSVVARDQRERGFRRLPPEQRAVFVFHHHLGLTLLEIADQLGIPLGTVKSRLHYATNTLRAALEADLGCQRCLAGAHGMNTNRDFDRIAAAWLAEGPRELGPKARASSPTACSTLPSMRST